jgi:hypothetical protein
MYQIAIHILNFRNPKQCTKNSDSLYKCELLWSYQSMEMEDHCLHECLKVFTDKAIPVLHHVQCTCMELINHQCPLIEDVQQINFALLPFRMYEGYAKHI